MSNSTKDKRLDRNVSIARWDRDRAILLGGCAAITAVAWFYLLRMAPDVHPSGHVHSHSAMDAGALFAMWTVMMVAMMVPSTVPFVLAFHAEQVRRRAQQIAAVSSAFFIAGYLATWTVFSGACAFLQEWLHRNALLSPAMSAASPIFSGAILIAAGAYQWSPMKNACLHHCRTPFSFLLSEWREGVTGAFRMGAEHGLFCIGCCWMLMMLPFAAGVMNLVWMAGLTVLLMMEKAAPGGERTGRISGALLLSLGAGVILFRFRF